MFELYALDLLDRDDRVELEAHLERGCPTCQENLKVALSLNAMLLGTCPDVAPHAGLKRRLMASIGVHRSGWGWLGAVATVCVLTIALWLGNQERQRSADLAEARKSILQVSGERDQLQQAFRILDQPETVQVTFGKGQPQPPRGNVFIHARLGVMLIASNLPRLQSGKIYEMWLIPKGGAPRPAGLFQSNGVSSALHILSGPVDTSSLRAVAVTVEPEAGSPEPTSQPLIVAAAGA